MDEPPDKESLVTAGSNTKHEQGWISHQLLPWVTIFKDLCPCKNAENICLFFLCWRLIGGVQRKGVSVGWKHKIFLQLRMLLIHKLRICIIFIDIFYHFELLTENLYFSFICIMAFPCLWLHFCQIFNKSLIPGFKQWLNLRSLLMTKFNTHTKKVRKIERREVRKMGRWKVAPWQNMHESQGECTPESK